MKKPLTEEFKRMQQLAGILNENNILHFNSEEVKLDPTENTFETFKDSDERGWMDSVMEEIAENEDLDLEYRGDFDVAFDKALDVLKKDHPELNFDLIMKFKENMF